MQNSKIDEGVDNLLRLALLPLRARDLLVALELLALVEAVVALDRLGMLAVKASAATVFRFPSTELPLTTVAAEGPTTLSLEV